MRETGNTVVDLSFKVALDIVVFTHQLENEKKFVVANQLLKSRTSIGANI
ncbi:MAG: four helix bundle protein [Flavobacteriaceae bacterium]|jgi:four helix bundle protein|nr:four helix bundle protein [Flavobacteriaceae bacterium]